MVVSGQIQQGSTIVALWTAEQISPENSAPLKSETVCTYLWAYKDIADPSGYQVKGQLRQRYGDGYASLLAKLLKAAGAVS